MTVRLTNVIVDSVNVGGGYNSEPNENVTFSYGKIQWEQGTTHPTTGSSVVLPPPPST